MNEDHKKPGVAFWTTAVLVVLLTAYPLSFGPACWMIDKGVIPSSTYGVFEPVIRAAMSCDAFRWYCDCWEASRRHLRIREAALEFIDSPSPRGSTGAG